MSRKNKSRILFFIFFLFLIFNPAAHAGSTHLTITNFTAGELTPLMEGRTDMAKYQSGCLLMENFLVLPHGPAQVRPGFKYVAEIKDSSKPAKLIPFQFSTEQAYILEFGESGGAGYMRVYMDQGQVVYEFDDATETISGGGFENAADCAEWTTYIETLSSVAGGKSGNCALNTSTSNFDPQIYQTMTVVPGKTYRLAGYVKAGSQTKYTYYIYDVTNSWGIYSSAVTTAPGAWSADPDIDYTFTAPDGCVSVKITLAYDCDAVGQTIYYDEIKLRRTDEPYEIATPYLSDDLPGLKYCQSADVMYLTHPDYDVRKLSRTGHSAWTLTTPTITSDPFTGADDYPSCCTFHENRLVFASTNTEPNSIWLSKSGAFEDFTTGVNDEDAIEITLASDQVNAVQWMIPSIYLTLGTSAGEWRLSATDPDDPITPTNITAKRELIYGSANHMAVQMGKEILFLQRNKRRIRKLAYNWESAGYTAPDMTVLSEHITEGGVTRMASQPEPFNVLWATRSDGTLLGLTYLPEHDVYAWSRHTTEGYFEDIAVIAGDGQDDLYAIVRRDIDGDVSRFVEVLASPFSGAYVGDAVYLDSAVSYSGTTTTTLTGAQHLANTPVYALTNGQVISGITVDSTGGVTIPDGASTVHIGLPYTATLQTMRLEAPTADGGTSQGRIKRISKAVLRLYKSGNFSAGPDTDDLLDIDTGVSLFTGDQEFGYPSGYEKDGHVTVVREDPTPLTVRSIIVKISTGD